MNKNTLIIFALLLVFGLSACNTGGDETTNSKWNGGTTGILISFVDGEPPEQVHTGGDEPFGVSIKLENKGEENVEQDDLMVTLRGFDPTDFGTTLADLSKNAPEKLYKTDLDPDTGNILDSTPSFVEFNLNYEADLGGASHIFPILAEVCYAYKTYASAELCYKKNLLDTKDDDVCTIIGAKDTSNSGAPLQITSVEEFTSGKDAIRFSFMIKKMSNGEVYSRDSKCNEERIDENKVHVLVDTGIDNLECSTLGGSNEGVVKLIEGEKQIICTQRLSESDKSDKVKLVNFELSYDFQDSAATTITVVSQFDG